VRDLLSGRLDDLVLSERFDPEPSVPSAEIALHSSTGPEGNFRFLFELPGEIQNFEGEEFLIEGLVPRIGLMTMYGGPGSGKSFAAIDMCGHIATGRPYFGKDVLKGGVVYVAAEAGTGLRKRLAAWRNFHGVEDFPFALIKVAPDLSLTGGDTSRLISDIRAQQARLDLPIRVVVLDTLMRVMPGVEENSSTGMGAFIASASAISEAFGCLTLAVHHTGKNEAAGMRGHSSLHGAADCEWQVAEGPDLLRTVILKKLKDGEDRLTWSFRLHEVTVFDPTWFPAGSLPPNSPTKPVVSCVIEPADMPSRRPDAADPPAIRGADATVLEAVRSAIEQCGELRRDEENSPGTAAVSRRLVQEIAIELGVGPDSGAKARAAMINRALNNLASKGVIEIRNDLISMKDED
jgi:hypothetical protein